MFWGKVLLAGLASFTTILLYLRLFRNIQWRDYRLLFQMLRVVKATNRFDKENNTVATFFDDLLKKRGRDYVLIFHGERKITLGNLEDMSNRIAHFALSIKLKSKDTVALYMVSRPEYIAVWLGLAKIGVRTALINFNLVTDSLTHSLKVSEAKAFILGVEQLAAVEDIQGALGALREHTYVYSAGSDLNVEPSFKSFDHEIATFPTTPVPKEFTARAQGVTTREPFLFCYTSGTTGLPKAASINHRRFHGAGVAFTIFFNVTDQDINYCSLPLYHASAGIIAVGMSFQTGCRLVIKSKFSASQFWPEVRKYNATIIQYIGEVCRYTLAQPPTAEDGKNRVRLALGNGLRPDVWKPFQERFAIKQIGEFYAATEAPAALVNTLNKPGAVGYISPLMQAVLPVTLVKFDTEKEEEIRDSQGRCIRCKPEEVGELLAQVIIKNGKWDNFSGYTNKEATQKKLLLDVFKKGDVWFRSGDLMKTDKEGFAYFVDRIGDTFRWRGENVSTLQVAEVVSNFPGCGEICVYGVAIPGFEGRAGMAAIVADENKFDWKEFAKVVNKNLPSYARPFFIRCQESLEVTGTFKHKKAQLREQGFDIHQVTDPIYFLQQDKYVKLTDSLYKDIISHKIKF